MYLSHRTQIALAAVAAAVVVAAISVVTFSARDDSTGSTAPTSQQPQQETTTTAAFVAAPAEHLEPNSYPPGVAEGSLDDEQVAACEGHAARVSEMLGRFAAPSEATSDELASYQGDVDAMRIACPGVGEETRAAFIDWLGDRSFSAVVADPTTPEGEAGEQVSLDDPALDGFEMVGDTDIP